MFSLHLGEVINGFSLCFPFCLWGLLCEYGRLLCFILCLLHVGCRRPIVDYYFLFVNVCCLPRARLLCHWPALLQMPLLGFLLFIPFCFLSFVFLLFTTGLFGNWTGDCWVRVMERYGLAGIGIFFFFLLWTTLRIQPTTQGNLFLISFSLIVFFHIVFSSSDPILRVCGFRDRKSVCI